jgi:hypothetical protein
MLTAIIWATLISTSVPLTWLWRTAETKELTRVAMVVMWGSFVWLLSAVAYAPLVGPHYSEIRLLLINANIAIVVLAAILLISTTSAKIPAVIAGGWLSLGWLYLRAVSFSV